MFHQRRVLAVQTSHWLADAARPDPIRQNCGSNDVAASQRRGYGTDTSNASSLVESQIDSPGPGSSEFPEQMLEEWRSHGPVVSKEHHTVARIAGLIQRCVTKTAGQMVAGVARLPPSGNRKCSDDCPLPLQSSFRG